MSQFNHQSDNFPDNQSATFADCIANSKQIFQLINSILPVESCIQHKILPLGLQNNYLTLGMLNVENLSAINAVRPIANSFGYYLNIKSIDAQTYQLILDNYFKASILQKSSNSNQDRDKDQTVIDINPIFPERESNKKLDSVPTTISQPKDQVQQPPVDSFMTLTEMPADFDFLREAPPQSKTPKPTADASMTLTEMPADFDFLREAPSQPSISNQSVDAIQIPSDSMTSSNLHEKSRLIVEDNSQIGPGQIISSEAQISNLIPETGQNSQHSDYIWLENSTVSRRHNIHQFDNFAILEVDAENPLESTDFLAHFTSQLSWQQLFEKILKHNTEELHLKRYSDRGNIICSKNGKVQSCLDRVPLSLFCALVDEIKVLAKLPLRAFNSLKKVAMEKFYQQERVILRLEFIPNRYGEDITIHILRNEVLQDYEQKQMDKMSEQALLIAQELEKTLKKMTICFHSAKSKNIRELQAIQRQINSYLNLLDR